MENLFSFSACFCKSQQNLEGLRDIYPGALFSPVLQIITHHENVKNEALERISKSNTNFLVGFSNLQVRFCENSGRIMGYIPKVELSIKNSSKQKIVQVCEFC